MATVAEILIDLPAEPDVAAGTVYGYTGNELTGSATDLASGSGVQRLKGRVPVWYMLGARAPSADATRLGVPTGVLGVLGNNDRLPALQVADGRFSPTAINLTAFVGETKTHTIVPRDTSGAPIDTGGVQLEYVIETTDGTDVQTGEITQDADTYEISIPTGTANETVQLLRYSVRVASTGVVVAYGRYSVAAVAEEDGGDGEHLPFNPSKISRAFNEGCLTLVKGKDYLVSNSNELRVLLDFSRGVVSAEGAFLTTRHRRSKSIEIYRLEATSVDSETGIAVFEIGNAVLQYEGGAYYEYMIELKHGDNYQAVAAGYHILLDDVAAALV